MHHPQLDFPDLQTAYFLGALLLLSMPLVIQRQFLCLLSLAIYGHSHSYATSITKYFEGELCFITNKYELLCLSSDAGIDNWRVKGQKPEPGTDMGAGTL